MYAALLEYATEKINSVVRKNELLYSKSEKKRAFEDYIKKNRNFSKKLLTSQVLNGIIIRLKEKAIINLEEISMSTFMAKKETVERRWYVIDAANVPLGKTAVAAATILRGKHRPEFTPHVDCGEFVIIINADKAVLTGKKLEQKYYYRHSGYIGCLKKVQYKTLMQTKPEKAMELAVRRMLPANTIGRKSMTRLKIYSGSTHKHEAQKPVAYNA